MRLAQKLETAEECRSWFSCKPWRSKHRGRYVDRGAVGRARLCEWFLIATISRRNEFSVGNQHLLAVIVHEGEIENCGTLVRRSPRAFAGAKSKHQVKCSNLAEKSDGLLTLTATIQSCNLSVRVVCHDAAYVINS